MNTMRAEIAKAHRRHLFLPLLLAIISQTLWAAWAVSRFKDLLIKVKQEMDKNKESEKDIGNQTTRHL